MGGEIGSNPWSVGEAQGENERPDEKAVVVVTLAFAV